MSTHGKQLFVDETTGIRYYSFERLSSDDFAVFRKASTKARAQRIADENNCVSQKRKLKAIIDAAKEELRIERKEARAVKADEQRKKREQKKLAKAKERIATQNERELARLIENQKRKISNKTKKKKRATVKAKSTIGRRHSYANQCIAVQVGGIFYASISLAAAAHNISHSAMQYRLNHGLYDSNYVDCAMGNKRKKKAALYNAKKRAQYRENKGCSFVDRRKRPVIADGVRYESRVAAAKAFNIDPSTIDWRIRSKYFEVHYE